MNHHNRKVKILQAKDFSWIFCCRTKMYQFQRISYCYRLTKCDILLASSGEENPTGSDAKKWGLFDYLKNGGEGYEIRRDTAVARD